MSLSLDMMVWRYELALLHILDVLHHVEELKLVLLNHFGKITNSPPLAKVWLLNIRLGMIWASLR